MEINPLDPCFTQLQGGRMALMVSFRGHAGNPLHPFYPSADAGQFDAVASRDERSWRHHAKHGTYRRRSDDRVEGARPGRAAVHDAEEMTVRMGRPRIEIDKALVLAAKLDDEAVLCKMSSRQ